MTFDATTYNLLISAVALILGFAAFYLSRIRWKNQKNFRVAALAIVFLVTWFLLHHVGTDVMVIRRLNYDELVVIGGNSAEVDGKNYILQQENSSAKFMINKTGRPLVFESLDYGDPSFPRLHFDRIFLFEPDSIENHYDFPDYFPWQPAPTSVSVMKGVKSDIKEWVRYATEEELSQAEEQKRIKEWNELGGMHEPLLESIKQSGQDNYPQ
ncbi:hypothetical protein D3C87_84920 [compost metagenome]